MVQGRGGTGFLPESRDAIGIGGEVRRQNFDRGLAVEVNIPGEPHLTHASSRKLIENFVAIEPSAGFEVHAER
jgi:hypothetical protein